MKQLCFYRDLLLSSLNLRDNFMLWSVWKSPWSLSSSLSHRTSSFQCPQWVTSDSVPTGWSKASQLQSSWAPLAIPAYYLKMEREQASNSRALSVTEDTTLFNKQYLWCNHSACQHHHPCWCPACNTPMVIKVTFVSTGEIAQQIEKEARLASVFVSVCSSIYSISFGCDLFHSHLFDLLPPVYPKPLLSSFSSFLGLYYCSLMALISHF